jgi:hypothetical protein
LDILNFIGICLLTAEVGIWNIWKKCSPVIGNLLIQETMPINKFEKIRQSLHFNNNENLGDTKSPSFDKLFKIRPLFDSLIHNFQKVTYEECICVDEQMCSTKARNYMKQYLPAKPHKWGYKLFVLCGVSGFAYNLEMYTGQKNLDVHRLSAEKNLGASFDVVVRLAGGVPRYLNHRIWQVPR